MGTEDTAGNKRQILPISYLNGHASAQKPCSKTKKQFPSPALARSKLLSQRRNQEEKCPDLAVSLQREVSVSIQPIFIVPSRRGGITHNFQWVFSESHLLLTIVQKHNCSATKSLSDNESKPLPGPLAQIWVQRTVSTPHRGWHPNSVTYAHLQDCVTLFCVVLVMSWSLPQFPCFQNGLRVLS